MFVGRDGAVRVHCHACGASGDVLDLIAATQGLAPRGSEFSKVIELAAELASSLPDTAMTAPAAAIADTAFAKVAEALLGAAPLAAQDDVVEGLRDRGIFEDARAEGWAALPGDAAGLRGLEQGMAERLGDLWLGSGLADTSGRITSPQHRIIIPWRSPEGLVTTLQRRVATGAPRTKYLLPHARGPLWPYGADVVASAPADGAIAFVEGAIDAISLRLLCRGHGAELIVLGLPGASAWKPCWAKLARGRHVHLAQDADEAGARGAARIHDFLSAAGITDVTRTRPRGANDWNELLRREERP